MPYNACVKFRGEDRDITLDSNGGYESDTNAHVIEWHFTGLSADEYDALKITDEEEQSIYEQLIEASYERAASYEPDFL